MGAKLKRGALLSLLFGMNANAMVMLGPSRRYFAVQQMLPPLALDMASFSNDTKATLPYSSHHAVGGPLPVTYTNNPKVVSQWLSNHVPASDGILGFDVESVPDGPGWIKKRASFEGPATVQLATTEACLVVHLTRRNGRSSRACAPILEAILGDGSIVKAGTGIDQDMLDLYECWNGLQARSRLELGGIGSDKRNCVGLQRLTSSILGLDLNKSKKVAVSDWSRVPLTDAQLAYSARDAWAGAAIVAELASRDEDAFGTSALLDLLQSERPLHDLNHSAQKRKRAKTQLTYLLKPYARPSKRGNVNNKKKMPRKVRAKVSKLKRIMRETSRGGPMVFDVAQLGVTIIQGGVQAKK